MILVFPIGPDRGRLRRFPLVTAAFMAISVVVFLWANLTSGRSFEEVRLRFAHAVEYFVEHPYLEPDAKLLRVLSQDADLGETYRLIDEARLKEVPPEAELLEQQQAWLDRLTGKWLATLESAPVFRLGLVPASLEPSHALTYLFLHAGWLHLLGNLLFLYLSGPYLEDDWGRLPFAAFLLAGGAASGVLYAFQYPSLEVPLVGASGAVAAVMGAFAVWLWKTQLRFAFFFFFAMGTFRLPAWLVLPLWGLGELYRAFQTELLAPLEGGGVAYWAHVWGFVLGVGVALVARYLQGARQSETDLAVQGSSSILEQARRLAEAGENEEAWRLLSAEVAANPGDVEVARALWDLSRDLRREGKAEEACQRWIAHELADGHGELALELWNELLEWTDPTTKDLHLELAIAEYMASSQRENLARGRLHAILDRLRGNPSIDYLVRLTELARRVDPELATRLADRLLTREDLPEDLRREWSTRRLSSSSEAEEEGLWFDATGRQTPDREELG